jgi:phosphonoacetaldehyde hydrolase
MQFKPIEANHKIRAVIFDWAGTTVDYGCFAPLEVFLSVFGEKGIAITLEEARGPMGMLKIDHIRALTQVPRIAGLWRDAFGKLPDEADVKALYARFEPALLGILSGYAKPIADVLEAVDTLRRKGLKIGSTTGYTQSMMDVVAPAAAKQGYAPDALVVPDGLPAGRPAPWMCYANAIKLGVYPMGAIVKVGDTLSDIREGVNAGCVSVGVIEGSSEMGLRESEAAAMETDAFETLCGQVGARYLDAGAHYVIRTLKELPGLIEFIDRNAEGA